MHLLCLSLEAPEVSGRQPPQANGGPDVVPMPDGSRQVAAPQMWTRKDITEFKSLLAKDPESVVNVGSGELVTVSLTSVYTPFPTPFEIKINTFPLILTFRFPLNSVD